MKRENLIMPLDTLYEFFKENNYHILRFGPPITTASRLVEARYAVLHCDGMKEALIQVEQGNIQLYNSLDNKMVYDQPMYLNELLESLEADFGLDVTPIYDLVDEHTATLKELENMLQDTELSFGSLPSDAYDTLDSPYFTIESFNSLLLNLLSVELEVNFLHCWGHLLNSVIDFAIDELIPAYQAAPYPLTGSDFHHKLKDNYIKLQLLADAHNCS